MRKNDYTAKTFGVPLQTNIDVNILTNDVIDWSVKTVRNKKPVKLIEKIF